MKKNEKDKKSGEEERGKEEITEKEKLLELYQALKDLGVNSISDLENKIARAGER